MYRLNRILTNQNVTYNNMIKKKKFMTPIKFLVNRWEFD